MNQWVLPQEKIVDDAEVVKFRIVVTKLLSQKSMGTARLQKSPIFFEVPVVGIKCGYNCLNNPDRKE